MVGRRNHRDARHSLARYPPTFLIALQLVCLNFIPKRTICSRSQGVSYVPEGDIDSYSGREAPSISVGSIGVI